MLGRGLFNSRKCIRHCKDALKNRKTKQNKKKKKQNKTKKKEKKSELQAQGRDQSPDIEPYGSAFKEDTKTAN